MALQERYDEAMFSFSRDDYDSAITQLKAILAEDPGYFDAQLSLGMAYYRKGELALALEEGHKAERLKPDEQLAHTNLSLFYVKTGDKLKAEEHGLKARIASWKGAGPAAGSAPGAAPAQAQASAIQFPAMPWKKAKGS